MSEKSMKIERDVRDVSEVREVEAIYPALLKQAYATPSLRQNILNTSMVSIYCDYSGHLAHDECGVACTLTCDGSVYVQGRREGYPYPGDSVYGELLAVIFSLENLLITLETHRPKFAIIYTDYSRIAKFLQQVHLSKHHYELIRERILAILAEVKVKYPDVAVHMKYIGSNRSSNRRNHALHHMAHLTARKLIGLYQKEMP
ncbi:hypothetical protein ACFO9Q_19655 [Paenibacillus sp. GCM10023252]|uniref:hypothetical protein n=1 Tax=Paenibacillus sp. GCM10023252 TaxID=3252649 RepID=UPI003617FF7F